MAGTLRGDQRALLQLLYERGQSYEDISGLLGVGANEVRERARAALAEIGEGDPDAEVPLTDLLLGKADPIARADAVRHLQGDPEALSLAQRIQAGLTLLAPGVKPVRLPEPRGRVRRAAIPIGEGRVTPSEAAVPAPSSERPDATTGRRRNQLLALLVGVGVVAVVLILAVAGVFDGGEASSGGDGTAAAVGGEEITSVNLKPVDGSGVAGKATFRLVDDEQLVIDLEASGLDPEPAATDAYLLWLIIGERAGYPVSTPLQPDANGSFKNTITVPTAIAVTFGSQATAVRLSRTPLDELRREVRAAAKQEVPILPFVGTDLASGKIPLVEREAGRGGKRRGNANEG